MANLSKSQLASIKKQVKDYKSSNETNETKKKSSKKQQIKIIKKEAKNNPNIKSRSKKVTWSIDVGDLVEYRNNKCIVVDLISTEKSSSSIHSAAIIVNSNGPKLVEIKTLKKL